MAQSDLQTLAELRQALEKCDENTAVSRLPGRRQVYLFPDGKAWKYTENVVAARDGNTYTEALFSDVSELYEKQLELEEQIRKLKQMAAKIRELSQTATTAAKGREVLATKTRLHTQMGENLTVMRQTLFASSTKKAQDAAARAMRKTVRFLMADSEAAGMDTDFDEFMQTAANSGVTVYIDGTLPKRQEPHEVFVIAMRECLTNSVRHGEADELRITLREENGSWLCGITNNGTAPKGEIKPQGGLKNLQRHVENCGGGDADRLRAGIFVNYYDPQRGGGKTMIRVLIVEDQKLSRETLERTVSESEKYELAGSLFSAELAMTFCLRNRVDLILMDVVTNGYKDGIQAAAEIREKLPDIKIIVVTSVMEADYIRRSREAGVDSFWYKDLSPQKLIEVMDQTMAGCKIYPETTPSVKLGLIQSTDPTQTEIKILRLVCEGYEYEEIAATMGTTRRTVHYHISKILSKTGYKNKTRLAVAASRCSLIVPTLPEDMEASPPDDAEQ